MKNRVAILFLTALLSAVTLCACSPQMPTISTDPLSDGSQTIHVGKPTKPAPGSRLTLSELMGEMGETMRWSNLKNYEYTQVDAVSAILPVSDAEGRECTLTVAFDETADLLTQATLSYEDVSVNILTDDTMVLRKIMFAMDEG